jgi:hypothetical protein
MNEGGEPYFLPRAKDVGESHGQVDQTVDLQLRRLHMASLGDLLRELLWSQETGQKILVAKN